MVIRDLHVERISVFEAEAYPPLVIDPDAPLPQSVSLQGFEPVPGWGAHVLNDLCKIELFELAQCGTLDIGKFRRPEALEKVPGVPAFERFDHLLILTHAVNNATRA